MSTLPRGLLKVSRAYYKKVFVSLGLRLLEGFWKGFNKSSPSIFAEGSLPSDPETCPESNPPPPSAHPRRTPVMASVTGCSTCSLGFSSRKKNFPVCALKRYSMVPAPGLAIGHPGAGGRPSARNWWLVLVPMGAFWLAQAKTKTGAFCSTPLLGGADGPSRKSSSEVCAWLGLQNRCLLRCLPAWSVRSLRGERSVGEKGRKAGCWECGRCTAQTVASVPFQVHSSASTEGVVYFSPDYRSRKRCQEKGKLSSLQTAIVQFGYAFAESCLVKYPTSLPNYK